MADGRTSFRLIAWVLAFAIGHTFVAPTLSQAQEAYSCIEELTEDQIDYRIQKIQRGFEENQSYSAFFRFSWLGLTAAITGGATALAIVNKDDETDKAGYAMTAAGAGVLLLTTAAVPMIDVWGAKRIKKRYAKTIEEKREKLNYATRLLERSSKHQAFFGGPNMAGAAVIYGIGTGTYLKVKYDEEARQHTLTQFIGVPVAGIAYALMHPHHSMANWENYRQIACSGHYYDNPSQDGAEFDLSAGPGSVQFKISF